MKKTISQFRIVSEPTDIYKEQIKTSKQGADFIRRNFYSSDIEIYESFFLLLLNRNNRVQGYAKISQGGIAGTVVDLKIIGKYILDNLASGVIMAHNHPSGNFRPSEADISTTKKVKELCLILDAQLLDHVILTADSHYSFADEGVL